MRLSRSDSQGTKKTTKIVKRTNKNKKSNDYYVCNPPTRVRVWDVSKSRGERKRAKQTKKKKNQMKILRTRFTPHPQRKPTQKETPSPVHDTDVKKKKPGRRLCRWTTVARRGMSHGKQEQHMRVVKPKHRSRTSSPVNR